MNILYKVKVGSRTDSRHVWLLVFSTNIVHVTKLIYLKIMLVGNVLRKNHCMHKLKTFKNNYENLFFLSKQTKRQYAVRFQNRGERTCCGEGGNAVVKCEDDTIFYFSRFDQSNNGSGVNRGQIPCIFYQK